MTADFAIAEAEELARSFFPAGEVSRVEPVPGGANNRAWRVDAPGGPYLLKQYYHRPPPARDRYASEQAFYAFAESRAPAAVPKALAWDNTRRAALFRFVPGTKLTPVEVTDARVSEALDFYRALNQPAAPSNSSLPEAAEACFRLAAHVELVERRIRRLLELPATTDELARAAQIFATEALAPAWQAIAANVRKHAPVLDATPPARGVSPSDFGFHNALLQPNGRLCFFDFEYAGWDDPAKTIADFLCQPDIPVGWERRTPVITAIAALFPGDPALPERARLLLPLYQIKWCCILLNDFLPDDQRRRAYALSADELARRRQGQLQKAAAALRRATNNN